MQTIIDIRRRQRRYRVWDIREERFLESREGTIPAAPYPTVGVTFIGPTGDTVSIRDLEGGRFVVQEGLGIQDRTGAPLFEGDIVEMKTSYGNRCGYIWWDPNRCGFYVRKDFSPNDRIEENGLDVGGRYKIVPAKMTKVGNIFQNPEKLDEP